MELTPDSPTTARDRSRLSWVPSPSCPLLLLPQQETVPVLRSAADVTLAGLVVSVDRMERGQDERRALAAIGEQYAMPTFAIVTVDEVIRHLHGREIDGRVPIDDATAEAMRAYLAEYGGR